jgi:4-diphosphocytidyl-2-C-methyl-D-erythritol kinase
MYPRKMGTAWEIYAPAKLNLYLDVLGRRSDGFHELETLMAPIRLYDRLQWRPAEPEGPSFQLSYDPSTPRALSREVPVNEANLIWRAVDLLARTAGIVPHGGIRLYKRIPPQAGLGGGSSDAAAALVLANHAWGLKYSGRRLAELAAHLGSDVPFFLSGKSAICRGRGEQVDPTALVPRLNVVVVVPPQGISTAAAFQSLGAEPLSSAGSKGSAGRLAQLLSDLARGAIAAASRRMTNALQSVAMTMCPWIEQLGTAFASTGCHTHLLTGSGSAYFGVMRSAWQARRAAALLSSANLGSVFTTTTCR